MNRETALAESWASNRIVLPMLPSTQTLRVPPRLIAATVLAFVCGFGLLSLGLYLVPGDARDIYTPFQELGEQRTATVLETRTIQRSYEGGGRRGGTKTYEESVVDVDLEGRKITISDLVLSSDAQTLSKGDSVSITLIRGAKAKEALPRGPFYLLTSSVEAGSLAYLGWAFRGRPARPAAVLTVIPGLVFVIAGLVLLALRPRKRPETGA